MLQIFEHRVLSNARLFSRLNQPKVYDSYSWSQTFYTYSVTGETHNKEVFSS